MNPPSHEDICRIVGQAYLDGHLRADELRKALSHLQNQLDEKDRQIARLTGERDEALATFVRVSER